MAEKRRSRRHARRLKVQFGESSATGFPHSGFTSDISATGLFVVSRQNPTPGTRLHLEVTLQGELPLYIEGVVTRHVQVPPELRQVVKAGFGVRFLLGAELMAELVPSLRGPIKDDPYLVTFDDEPAWRAAVDKDLKRGGVFVWTPMAVAQNTLVTVTFDLRFAGRQLAFEAKVVQSIPGADGRFGVALMFVDAPAAAAAFAATLGG